jgi:hypothetical protein
MLREVGLTEHHVGRGILWIGGERRLQIADCLRDLTPLQMVAAGFEMCRRVLGIERAVEKKSDCDN